MSFRKNVVSYAVWMIFSMCNGFVFSFLGMLCMKNLSVPTSIAAMGLTIAFFVLLFLIYLLTGFAYKNSGAKKSDSKVRDGSVKTLLIWEGVIAVTVLTAGIILRIYMLPEAGQSAAYFDVAKVSQESTELMVPVQGSVYYYIYLLHGIFLLFGNQWLAGIWLQIILQIVAACILYFVVRKMAGVFCAVTTLGYLMFSPSSIREGLTYSPQMLYLCLWALCLLCIMLYLNRSIRGGEKESVGSGFFLWAAVVLTGIFVGFSAYADISGIVLLVPVLLLPMVYRESRKKAIWVFRMVVGILSGVLSFFGFLYIDALLSGSSFSGVVSAWLVTYQPEVPDLIALLQNSSLEIILLLVFLSINVFSFHRRKKSEIITPWILMLFVLAVLYVMGITTESMNGRYLVMVLMSIAAVISVRELFAFDGMEQTEENAETVQIIELDPAGNEEKPAASVKPRFIENPLPLPKKHVKKVMDYGFVPDAAQMKYDVEVADSDDFDV